MQLFIQHPGTVIKNMMPGLDEEDEEAVNLEGVHVDLPGKPTI